MSNKHWLFLLALIILLASAFRFVDIDWDSRTHVHPDERFLSMLMNDITWPKNADVYFDTANSTLNPANAGRTFFVYGTFPIFLTKFTGDMINMRGYDGYTFVGRALSGLFDIFTLIVVFLIARNLFDVKTALLSALLFAFSVLNIQHSHFFVVDLFTTFFVVLSFYFLLLLLQKKQIRYAVLLGISWGLGLASKMSAILFAGIIFLGCIILLVNLTKEKLKKKRKLARSITFAILHVLGIGLLILAMASIVFRIAQPYDFEGPKIWNVKLSKTFTDSFAELSRLGDRNSEYPPTLQWRNRSPFFQVNNLTFWGLGLPLGIICWLGVLLGLYHLVFKKEIRLLLPLAWIIFIIIYQGAQFARAIRYLLPITPFLIMFGAWFIVTLTQKKMFIFKRKRSSYFLATIIIVFCLLWAAAFSNIYLHKHPLVQASAWIYENLPENTTVSIESWDTTIPLQLPNMPPPPRLNLTALQLFGEDNDEKIRILSEHLSASEYIFITSGRNYMVIPRLEKYLLIKRYYELLFNESLGFKIEKEFTNYPKLFGIEISDDKAEESFSVYDHPKAFIFKNEKRLKSKEIANLINGVE